jgi:DNA-binding ferritin-like protein
MSISRKPDGWYWDTQGPFQTRSEALSVGAAMGAPVMREDDATDAQSIGIFVATMLQSAEVAHVLHFRVTGPGSRSAHLALQTYYEAIPDLVDTLTESIMGLTLTLIPVAKPFRFGVMENNPLDYIQSLQNYVRDQREMLPSNSEIQNEVDNIATLLNTTAYQLRFLA